MRIIKIIPVTVIVFTVGLLLATSANSTLLFEDIDLGGGSTADIHVASFDSSSDFCQSLPQFLLNKYTIFAVHGINSDAFVWGPLSDALFNNNPAGGGVCKVLAIEMPGHGGSGLPSNMLFGQLTHTNYANAIINTLIELAEDGIEPVAMMAHSNGGLNLQVAQEILNGQGSSFSEEFGIEKITMFAIIPSAPVQWPVGQQTSEFLANLAGCFSGPGNPFAVGCDPFDTEPDGDVDWDDVSFFDPSDIVFDCDPNTVPVGIAVPPPGCENPSTLGDRTTTFLGFPAPDEPLNIVRSAFGAAPQVRPVTSPGTFAGEDMATLNMVSFEDDLVIGPSPVHLDLFNHLASDDNGAFHIVSGADHVHLFFNPVPLLNDLGTNGICLIPEQVSSVPTLSEWGYITLSVLVMIAGIYYLRFRRKAISNI